MLQLDDKTIGGRIRKARTERELTLKDLAARTGATPNYLSVVERGEKPPSSALLKKIAKATGTSYAWLLSGSGSQEADAHAAAGIDAHVDPQLFLSLVLARAPGITKDTLATLLMTSRGTVDAILAGEGVDYDPQWAAIFPALARKLDIAAVRRELGALDALLAQQEKSADREALLRSLRDYVSKKAEKSEKKADYKIYCPIERRGVRYSMDDERFLTTDANYMTLHNKNFPNNFWYFLYLPLPAATTKESVREILTPLLARDSVMDRSDALSIVLDDRDVYERFEDMADEYLDHHHLQFEDPTGSVTDAFPRYTTLILVDAKTWNILEEKELVDEEYWNNM